MGVGRIFSRGGDSRGFSQNFFQEGAESGEIWFLPLEIEKTTFFANHFKIQGGTWVPLPLLPTPMLTPPPVHRHAFPHCFLLLFLCLFHLTLILCLYYFYYYL